MRLILALIFLWIHPLDAISQFESFFVDEDSIGRGFFKRFQKRIKSLWGQHMYLIDNEYLVIALLGLEANLLHQLTDMIYTVVGRCI